MRTLADVKRRMAPGVQLEVLEQTRRPELIGTVRTIVSSSSSNLVFTSSNTGSDEYHQAWPKARDVRILDADTYEIDLRGPGMTDVTIRLRFIAADGDEVSR